MHFLLISENEVFFFHEIKRNGMTSFMEFMCGAWTVGRTFSNGHCSATISDRSLILCTLNKYIPTILSAKYHASVGNRSQNKAVQNREIRSRKPA